MATFVGSLFILFILSVAIAGTICLGFAVYVLWLFITSEIVRAPHNKYQ